MKEWIKNKTEEFLSKEFYCTLAELQGKETVYSVNPNTKQPYIKILAYKNSIIVCTSNDLHSKIKELLRHKNRDEIFEIPFVYGQTIHFVPQDQNANHIRVLPSDSYEVLFDREILSLKGLKGFENSLSFDHNGFTATKAVCIAKDDKAIVGIAGAAESSVSGLWEIGADVMEKYRNGGLGSFLVSQLTKELLMRNIVPFYSASVTNIGSQMVASRCGYIPGWIDTFGTTLDGSSAYDNIVCKMDYFLRTGI